MGTGAEAIPAIISLAATAAGTGISMYSQQQQARTAQRMAEYNSAIQRQDAEVQTRLALYQAGVNAQMAQAQAQAKFNNAQSLANQVPGVEAQSRERARRLREEKERMLSMQRAKFANSGVVNEGTPLVVLADSSQLSDLNIRGAMHEGELQRQDLLRQADLAKFEGGFSLLEADQQRYKGLAATAGQRIQNQQADYTRLVGDVDASQYRAQATASLISGIGSAASQTFDYGYKLYPDTWGKRKSSSGSTGARG